MFNDYYAILEIDENASVEDISTGYRKQAKKHHPDVNHNEGAKEKMQLINEAYLILSDKEARERYDKAYSTYKSFVYQKESNQSNYNEESSQAFTSTDELLNKWIENARRQAKEMVATVKDEIKGTAEESGKSIANYFWYFAPFIIGYLLIRGCSLM